MSAEEVCKPLIGSWKCDNSRSEKFDELLTLLGVNFVARKLATKSSPKLTFAFDDGKFIVKNEGAMSTKTATFPVDGGEIDEEGFGGAKSKSHFTIEDGKPAIVTIPTDPKLKKIVVTREIVDGDLVQLINVADGELISKRVFVKVP